VTEDDARAQINLILDDLAIGSGDVVYLAIDMGRLPLPAYPAALSRDAIRAREERWCRFLLDCLLARLGAEGTILAPTFTYAYAARQEPYVHEESPSETGVFTEYLRRHPQARRSLHPIHSVAGLGRRAAELLDDIAGRAAYGEGSVFARLDRVDTKFLCLGASLGASLTYAHHMEQVYGVNHRYTKVFRTPVHQGGREVPGPWLCFMRYLGTPVRANVHALESGLRAAGVLRESTRFAGAHQCAAIADVRRVGYAMLARDPWAFAKEPVEIRIEADSSAKPPKGRETTVSFVPQAQEA
jgi:aminoglycoside 3-N-acetyltransferase